jgi:hypothetical protein
MLLNTLQQFQKLRGLGFCYLCGKPLSEGRTNLDHVPPKNIFAVGDRTPPLKLPVHESCNSNWILDDEKMGQLLGGLHGKSLDVAKLRLQIQGFQDLGSGNQLIGVGNLDVRGFVRRCLRGFHAALYEEPLPDNVDTAILTPFAEGQPEADGVHFQPTDVQFFKFSEFLQKSHVAGATDRVEAYNGKCLFKCAWSKDDSGRAWIGIFGLDIYNWVRIAGDSPTGKRGCIGAYFFSKPSGASIGTDLEFNLSIRNPLDPFEIG